MRDEAILLAAAIQGEAAAFDQLLEPYTNRAYRMALLITHSPEGAADALQEALIRSYRSLRNVRAGSAFYPWFARIVVNEAIKQTKRARTELPLPDWAPSGESPERAVLDREEREHLWHLIQQLSPAHRAVIVLRYYEDLSEAEIADVLEVSPGTVKSRLHYARQALGERLKVAERRPTFFQRLARIVQGGLSS